MQVSWEITYMYLNVYIQTTRSSYNYIKCSDRNIVQIMKITISNRSLILQSLFAPQTNQKEAKIIALWRRDTKLLFGLDASSSSGNSNNSNKIKAPVCKKFRSFHNLQECSQVIYIRELHLAPCLFSLRRFAFYVYYNVSTDVVQLRANLFAYLLNIQGAINK